MSEQLWVILDQNYLTETIRAGQSERLLPNGQALLRVNSENEDLLKDFIKYNQEQLPDLTSFEKHMSKHSIPVDKRNIPLVVQEKANDPSFPRSTHDFCNKTTWWTNSIRVENEELTSADNLTFSAANDFFIDVINGITPRQHLLQASHGVILTVDGSQVSEGFTINHRAGTITFDQEQNGTVEATYSYATNSRWSLKAEPGKILNINKSEIQFSMDVQIQTPLRFEVWIDNPYVAVEGHPLFGVPRITAKVVQYNSMRDFVNESNLGQGFISQVGDLPSNIVVFPFNYISNQPIQSSFNAELVISSVGDAELTGSYGTATFYLISKDE
jgi:hypothetical protein